MSHAIAQGQIPHVVFRRRILSGIAKIQKKVAQDLVGTIASIRFLLLGDEAAVHQFLRFQVLALEEELTDGGQALGCFGVAIVGLGTAPKGDFVEHDVFAANASVGHHAQTPIAQREGFLPNGGGRGIIEAVVARVGGRRRSLQAQGRHKDG